MRSGFFNSHSGDRKYQAEDWAAYFKQFIGNGIYANPASSMAVAAAGKLTVRILAGSCFINGYAGYADGTDITTLNNHVKQASSANHFTGNMTSEITILENHITVGTSGIIYLEYLG